MRGFVALLSAGVAVSASSAFAFNSFVGDARRDAPITHYPYTAIGKLVAPDSWCSATLVGPDLVLTAAHCFVDDKGEEEKGTRVFREGYDHDASAGDAHVVQYWLGTHDTKNHRDQDWAIAKLTQKLGNLFGTLGVESTTLQEYLNQEKFIAAAFASDYKDGEVMYLEERKTFTGIDEGSGLAYDNFSSSPGASGSALFYNKGTEKNPLYYIVATQVAELRDPVKDKTLLRVPYSQDVANIAVPAANFIGKLQELLAAEKK